MVDLVKEEFKQRIDDIFPFLPENRLLNLNAYCNNL